MIDCVNERVWYLKKNKKRKKRKKILPFFIVIFFILLLIYHYLVNISVFVANECEARINEIALTSINMAVMNTVNDLYYNDMVVIEKDKDGNITYFSVDSLKANQVTQKVISETKKILNDNLKKGVTVSLGSILGLKILSGIGKGVKLKIVSVESVNCLFKSTFLGEGINQTIHRLKLDLTVNSKILVPFEYRNSFSFSEILLNESVIVGKIPEIYLNN